LVTDSTLSPNPSLDSLTDGVRTITGDRYGSEGRILQWVRKFYF
jgi:hypothetical protein